MFGGGSLTGAAFFSGGVYAIDDARGQRPDGSIAFRLLVIAVATAIVAFGWDEAIPR